MPSLRSSSSLLQQVIQRPAHDHVRACLIACRCPRCRTLKITLSVRRHGRALLEPAPVMRSKLFAFGALPAGGPGDGPAAQVDLERGAVAQPVDGRCRRGTRPGPGSPSRSRRRSTPRPAGPRTGSGRSDHCCQPPEVPDRGVPRHPSCPVGEHVPSLVRASGSARATDAARASPPGSSSPVSWLVCPFWSGSVVQSSCPTRVGLDEHVVPVRLGVVRGPERQVPPACRQVTVRVRRL